jgi:hypothetical protein
MAAAAAAAAVVMGGVGCSASSDSLSSVSEGLEQASNTGATPELVGLMKPPRLYKREAIEGFRCDSSPDQSTVSVCGQDLPASVHLEWTDCQAMARREGAPPRGEGEGEGAGAGAADGGMPPAGEAKGPGPSSGVVDIAFSYATPNGCDGAIEESQVVTFDLERTRPSGEVSQAKGTVTSTETRILGEAPEAKSFESDVKHTVTDSAGALLEDVHLVGSGSVAFSGDDPPSRTENGSYTAEAADGTTSSLSVTDVVFPPMETCPWPVSGTVSRTEADGTVHTLVYGPECGAATLDGAAVQLPARRGGGHGGGGEREGGREGGGGPG